MVRETSITIVAMGEIERRRLLAPRRVVLLRRVGDAAERNVLDVEVLVDAPAAALAADP